MQTEKHLGPAKDWQVPMPLQEVPAKYCDVSRHFIGRKVVGVAN